MCAYTSDSATSLQTSLPGTVIIIGAGVFGLSTALAIAKRYPSTQTIVVDRLTPPVQDGTSVDTTRCIRSDYLDPIYMRLAKKSQKLIQQDPDLKHYLYQQGMTFVCDGHTSRFTEVWKTQLERGKSSDPESFVELSNREEVFQRIHGENSQPPSLDNLNGNPRWKQAYCNLEDAFIDAKESIQVYYDRCLKLSSISFICGSAVDHIDIVEGKVSGYVGSRRQRGGEDDN